MLHSTGQLYSHKRKHERRDFEHAYRRFKDDPLKSPSMTLPHQLAMGGAASGMMTSPGMSQMMTSPAMSHMSSKEYVDLEDLVKMNRPRSLNISESSSAASHPSPQPQDLSLPSTPGISEPTTPSSVSVKLEPVDTIRESKVPPSTIAKLASKLNSQLNDSLTLPIPGHTPASSQKGLASLPSPLVGVINPPSVAMTPVSGSGSAARAPSPTMGICHGGFVPKVSPPVNEKKERDETWKKYLTRSELCEYLTSVGQNLVEVINGTNI